MKSPFARRYGLQSRAVGFELEGQHHSRTVNSVADIHLWLDSAKYALDTCRSRTLKSEPPTLSPLAVVLTAGPRRTGIVFDSVVQGDVVPAVILSLHSNKPHAEAAVFERSSLSPAVCGNICSAAKRALVDLAARAFSNVLARQDIALSRFRHLCEANADFLPEEPPKREWTIAAMWDDWQQRRLGHPAMARELAKMLDTQELDVATFRKVCQRLGLRIRDKSQRGLVTI